MDFSSKLKEVEHLLSKEEYTASATRSMLMIEQALRQMVNLSHPSIRLIHRPNPSVVFGGRVMN